MSLNLAMSTASRSLRAIETQLSVATANMTSADVKGYTRKSATKVTEVTAGVGTGATITEIVSKVDPWLLKSIISASSSKEASAVTYDYLSQLGQALGALSSDSSSGGTLATAISSLTASLTKLATTPDSATLKSDVVGDLDTVAAALRSTSSQVQNLRLNADSDIADAVDTANTALNAIDALNDSIVRAQASGQSTSDLEDQRMNKVADLAGVMGITYFTQANGAMVIYTSGGKPLLNSTVHPLSFKETSTMTSGAYYSDIPPKGNLSGISVDGEPITGTIRNGSLSSLLTMRDKTLPGIQTELDTIAKSLRDTLNSVHNDSAGTSSPSSLSGSVGGVNALGMSGTLKVVITDADGKAVSSADIDLSTISTVSDLKVALDAVPGLDASIDADGRLSVTTNPSSTGVILSGGTVSSVNGTTLSAAKSLSAALGLNDLVSGTGAETISVRSDILASPKLLATSTLNSTVTVGSAPVSIGTGTRVQALANAITASGVTAKTNDTVSGVSSRLSAAKEEASSQQTALTTLTSSFSSKYGVNIDEETATVTALQKSYSASAQVFSAANSMFDALLQAVR
ncbi:flagellar hook-associated protein FlgK [Magnetospirillum molischianum]|uniref:Flagellar hook-associated protein 1 n=1 Tax=Magnetospirillum molischianum DSM 120 TaxID=1150626 RepID=H8FWC6_MAGML|nr:flagellar hook-associated protein FlgK [Magnetospirillum molischianum]CCG42664.1 putative flagellar hook-associated protein 1 (HAP1, FlgK protein) [Magnetospirillum molischianum DSM 120]